MKIPTMRGLIARRLLVNFRADPQIVAPLLPAPLRPQLHDGNALVGVCLIRLERLRPNFLPLNFGLSSENAAHRFAVEWDENGQTKRGVYIARRDTNSRLSQIAGGRIFPGQHFGANFQIEESAETIALKADSHDGKIQIEVAGEVSENWPQTSIFPDLPSASAFFEAGSLGYSARRDGKTLDALRLETFAWKTQIFQAKTAFSSVFSDEKTFPKGSLEFDHVLLMRGLEHQWHSEAALPINKEH